MSSEENKALIHSGFKEDWNKGNLDIIAEIFATDFLCHKAGNPDISSHEGWKQFVINLISATLSQISILQLRVR